MNFKKIGTALLNKGKKLYHATKRQASRIGTMALALFVTLQTTPVLADTTPTTTLGEALTVDVSANMVYLYASMAVVMGIAVALFIFRKNKGVVKYG